jgi:hypothetical protein
MSPPLRDGPTREVSMGATVEWFVGPAGLIVSVVGVWLTIYYGRQSLRGRERD